MTYVDIDAIDRALRFECSDAIKRKVDMNSEGLPISSSEYNCNGDWVTSTASQGLLT